MQGTIEKTDVLLLYNDTASYSLPMMFHAMSSAIYQSTNAPDPDWNITVSSQALPDLDPQLSWESRVYNAIRLMGTAVGLCSAWFGFEIVADREVNRADFFI